MKTLKSILTLGLLLTQIHLFADDQNSNYKLSMDYALKTYLSAVTEGNSKGFAEILDRDVKFTMTRGDQIINYTKSEMISNIKANEGVKQNCSTSSTVVESNATQSIVKVTQKYEDFTRVDFVTLTNTVKGWKITNVSSSFI